MYYPDLEKLSCYRLMAAFINEFDVWLAALPNGVKDRITIETISNSFGVSYDIVQSIFTECCELGIFEEVYAITCPECEFTLKLSDRQNLIKDMNAIHYCYSCENEDIKITSSDIHILYKLIKEPDRQFSIKKTKVFSDKVSTANTLDKQLEKNPTQINSFYYAPSSEDYHELAQLYDDLDREFKNTSDQGAALDQFISKIFSIVPCFSTSTRLQINTTQIDCCVKNDCSIRASVFDIIGNFFIIECKNEKKKSNNTYLKKLSDTMDTMGIKFGIIASRQKWASTCDELAREKFLKHNRFIINLCNEDYNDLVYNKVNLLNVLHDKAIALQTNSKQKLFE